MTLVCVLDDAGCDRANGYLQPYFTAGTGGPGGNGSSSGFTHGTYCAGIVAYTAGGLGNCRIMPVAYTYPSPGLDGVIANAIDWAANKVNDPNRQPARIINISTRLFLNLQSSVDDYKNAYPLITDAINTALAKNILICVASGDDTRSTMSYPAILASQVRGLIAVGACDGNGHRVNYSNYGQGMSVVADSPFDTSYLGTPYQNTFPGTSAAAPQVAGLAARILSVNPSLSNVQVQDIIEQTAGKVGGYTYQTGYPNGTWNQEMGYGRIDVVAALTRAQTTVNHAPTTLALSANRVAENAINGTVVGTVSATDPDVGDTLTYSLTDSAGGRFAIDRRTGALTVSNGSLLDFEVATSHTITVRVTDSGGLTLDKSFTITVTDVNEAPTEIASQGTGTLRGTWLFDLDNGIEGGGPGCDIWWEQMTNVARQMVPQNNARIVNLGVVDFNSITAESLKTLPYGTTPIPGNNDATNQLVPGDVFAVLTNQGNYAKVLVLNYGYNLNIQWVTYA